MGTGVTHSQKERHLAWSATGAEMPVVGTAGCLSLVHSGKVEPAEIQFAPAIQVAPGACETKGRPAEASARLILCASSGLALPQLKRSVEKICGN